MNLPQPELFTQPAPSRAALPDCRNAAFETPERVFKSTGLPDELFVMDADAFPDEDLSPDELDALCEQEESRRACAEGLLVSTFAGMSMIATGGRKAS